MLSSSNICELISPLFYRTDSRATPCGTCGACPRASLASNPGWTMAEFTGLREPKALQRFLNLTK